MADEDTETESDTDTGSDDDESSSTHSSDYSSSSEEEDDDNDNDDNTTSTPQKPKPHQIQTKAVSAEESETESTDDDQDSVNGEEYETESTDDDDDDDDDAGDTDSEEETDSDDDDDDDDHDDDNDVNTNQQQKTLPTPGGPDADTPSSSDDDDDDDDTSGSGSGIDDEGDDDDDDMDDEEAEPQLKYQRLGGGVTSMMINDSASCLKCHPRFLVLGMKSGSVYVLDPHGDIIKQYRPHLKNAVNDISIDQNGDHVATCSKDGRVVIRDIFKDVQTVHNFRNQDLLSIELHPNYGTQQMFVTGGRGQQLLLRSIGFFRSDNKVLHSGEGPIYCIAWQCELIAWANDRGVKIYDISDHKPIAHINRSNRGSPDPERYKCCLCWENRETLLIGWGDWVKIGRIRTVRTQQGHMMKEVHVTNVFITDFYICGIAPFKEHLVLLAFLEGDDDGSDDSADDNDGDNDNKNDDNNDFNAGIGSSKPPELRIVSRRGDWIATDALPINKYKSNLASSYKLVWSHDDISSSVSHLNDINKSSVVNPYDNMFSHPSSQNIGPHNSISSLKSRSKLSTLSDETFYIVSPYDIVASLPRNVEDHINWLWDRGEYETAWRESVRYSDDLIRSKLNSTSLGEEFLRYILEKDSTQHHRFGSLCREVCLNNKLLWEKWISKLFDCNKLSLIIDSIPLREPQLNCNSYELILRELIRNNHRKFLNCIMEWNQNLYSISKILTVATNRLNEVRRSDYLIQSLAELYRMNQDFDKALEYYLQLKSSILIKIPERYNIVYLVNNSSNYNDYLLKNNATINAMIKSDKEQKYNDKIQNIMDKKDVVVIKAAADDDNTLLFHEEFNRIQINVFNMIIKHKLWDSIQNKILDLIQLDIFQCVRIFSEYRNEIHPNYVFEQITLAINEIDNISKKKDNKTIKQLVPPSIYKKYLRFFMFLYFHQLVGIGDGSAYPEFHDFLVALYAEFHTAQLNNFLALSHHVKFSVALSVCRKRLSQTSPSDDINRRNLNECFVFILNRMGNYSEALHVILTKLNDVSKAVKFVEKQSDKSLWNHLIEKTLSDATKLMPKLLDAIKGHPNIDSKELIQKIPNKLKIRGLKQKIIAIFEEYSREKLLTKGTTNILQSDCLKLTKKLYNSTQKGCFVNYSNKMCMVCLIPLNVYPAFYTKNKQQVEEQEQVEEDKKEEKEEQIGTDRISIISKKQNPSTPLWKCRQLSEIRPSLKIFHCGHFYHLDCYRDAQFHKKYSIAPGSTTSTINDIDKCVICFSGQTKKAKY